MARFLRVFRSCVFARLSVRVMILAGGFGLLGLGVVGLGVGFEGFGFDFCTGFFLGLFFFGAP